MLKNEFSVIFIVVTILILQGQVGESCFRLRPRRPRPAPAPPRTPRPTRPPRPTQAPQNATAVTRSPPRPGPLGTVLSLVEEIRDLLKRLLGRRPRRTYVL